jgi:DnaK suppressor protein
MTYQALQQFRRRLITQRSSLLERWRRALSEENELFAASAPDERDTSAARIEAAAFDGINAQGRTALARIQSSLARIERGTYEECVACHSTITEEWLRAFPDTDRCGHCAPRLN